MSNNDSSRTEEDGRTGVGRAVGHRVRSSCQKATINSPLLNSPFFSRPSAAWKWHRWFASASSQCLFLAQGRRRRRQPIVCLGFHPPAPLFAFRILFSRGGALHGCQRGAGADDGRNDNRVAVAWWHFLPSFAYVTHGYIGRGLCKWRFGSILARY